MTKGPDDLPIPRLGPAWDASQQKTPAAGAGTDDPHLNGRRETAPRWRASRAVPVAVAVAVTLLLQRYAGGILLGQAIALLLLVLIAAVFGRQYRHHR